MSESCDILTGAKQWLVEHKWQRNGLFGIEITEGPYVGDVRGAHLLTRAGMDYNDLDDPEKVTHVCALGAVYLVACMKYGRDDQTVIEHTDEAVVALAEAMWPDSIPYPDITAESHRMSITTYNDRHERTSDEVLEAFDKAIDKVCE